MKLIKKKTKGIQPKGKTWKMEFFLKKENLFALLLNRTQHVNLENS